MNKQILIELIEKKYSTRKIANELNTSQSTIKYWLHKFNLKTNIKIVIPDGMRYCSKCDNIKSISEFYVKYKNTDIVFNYCKQCKIEYDGNRFIQRKIKLIKYKGSKCLDCDINLTDSNHYIFDFHHRDPKKKEISGAKLKMLSWNKAKIEIDKCDLLCSNCHRMRHHVI